MNAVMEKFYKLNAHSHYWYFRIIKRKQHQKRVLDKKENQISIASLLDEIDIPLDSILFLHVGLQELKSKLNISYDDLTKNIVEELEYKFKPHSIIVPTFTWSFIESGIYSKELSRSETGKFSEIFRSIADYRTPNAIQSFCIKSKYHHEYMTLNHEDTFGVNGIYDYLLGKPTYIIDINTDTFRASPLHHLERLMSSPYLKADYREFNGYMIDDGKTAKICQAHGGTYIYEKKYIFNKEKIERFLERHDVVSSISIGGFKISYMSNKDMYTLLTQKMKKNPYYPITF